ncbi:acyl-CoA dehydratase activase [Mesotoga prima]|uniref:acyl-CoA dehydratase activase n=2 Tax=Mesotoga prima TaxID=1184387 RepID=UPI0002CBA256|nr:acyl-CoA dehydratase activase [Mesotoga prima]CCU85172.1 CoA-substrate-specific enzyme activase [Mesotoga infera]HNQ70802.1 acyl-CoA dehydratase activase [Mesotoga prima]HNS75747.1 acyl-CoA dehydratase activase [Mesotoga prima]
MNRIGLCIGSSTISWYDGQTPRRLLHEGNPLKVLKSFLPEILETGLVVVTGKKGRKLLNLPQIPEVEATEFAYKELKSKYGDHEAIVSVGGENFTLYKLNDKGNITAVFTGSKCASGTGEFFLQQLKRMDIGLDDANAVETDEIYELSSRCTVFCKSDCTHALNKGTPKESVLNGLGKVMSDKIGELMHRAGVKKILLVGGVTKNRLMLNHLEEIAEITIPEEALFFEAFGAYLHANTLEEIEIEKESVFKEGVMTFPKNEPLSKFVNMVDFKNMPFKTAESGDSCILGVDVGSTTTKAVFMRARDNAILASSYLRTMGDPINATRQCLDEICNSLDVPIEIIGLGVTGSGRKIVGLYCETSAVYNEIMAHARAASFFDREVDTIFEIGGQDAKYTFLSNGVALDYAMNEACSAGTGSFLEESAKESLNIDYREIGEYALKGQSPPNFSDQCAAFISSDIKTAINEGISREDICAGLVYSICLNYTNRVKAMRPVGKKVFMQGGVCLNQAVPVAMAAVSGKEIIVPPHPGLMGAFGVSLMVKEKLRAGQLEEERFELEALISKEVRYLNTFICDGGAEKCDRKCPIRIIEVGGKKFPFGGACNKYENVRLNLPINRNEYIYTTEREKIVFKLPEEKGLETIGISKSLSMNTLFPLFSNFFSSLGFRIVVPDKSDPRGWDRKKSEFCFPVELSHGYTYDLLDKNPDYFFIPAVKGLEVENSVENSVFCPFVQSEPDWLMGSFEELRSKRILTDFFDFSQGFEKEKEKFVSLAKSMGRNREEALAAFSNGVKSYEDSVRRIKQIGERFLENLKNSDFGVVIFGRAYNAFSSDANMGIPEKLASRGIPVVTFDALPYEGERSYEKMYWAWGEMNLKAARYVRNNPKLFALYITNFSCGPDSFLISFFRDIMGKKPSLILELDSHTSDAGVETRIEAFADVVRSSLERKTDLGEKKRAKRPKLLPNNGTFSIELQDGRHIPITDPSVKVIVPTMGEFAAQLIAAAFEKVGINTHVLPRPTELEFQLGKSNSLSKECLPFHLTLGSLIRYLEENKDDESILMYFMPDTRGPCRFGQYSTYIDLWLDKNNANNVLLFSLNSENGYAGIGLKAKLRIWASMIIADEFCNVENALLTLASDRDEAAKATKEARKIMLESVKRDSFTEMTKKLEEICESISHIPLKGDFESAPKVLLSGEIYVRNDEFSRKSLELLFADNGIIMHASPIEEWIYYLDYILLKKYVPTELGLLKRGTKHVETLVKQSFEKRIKKILEKSGLYKSHFVDIESMVNTSKDFLNPKLTGEAILTLGAVLFESIDTYDGVISIGPFGCMPTRIAEAIAERGLEHLRENSSKLKREIFKNAGNIPILFFESDGNPFTPTVESRLESFVVQVKRVKSLSMKLKSREFK